MAKTGKLTALAVTKAKEKGLYADGGNLYLQVTATGSKSWVFRYMMDGKPKIMGLGALHAVPLASVLGNNGEKLTLGAREMAANYRNLLASGIDPMDARKAEQVKIKLASSHNITFEQCAIAYVEAHKASWKNAKHIWQWDNTLTRFVYPILGKVPVNLKKVLVRLGGMQSQQLLRQNKKIKYWIFLVTAGMMNRFSSKNFHHAN